MREREEILLAEERNTIFGESQRDLRYILTQQCNYQCSFCHKEGCDGDEKSLLDSDDYAFLFSVAKESLGIHKTTFS